MFNSDLDALYACRNHWQWLWITGSKSKKSYEPATHWVAECACCDYVKYCIDCIDCPLIGYAWPKGCMTTGSFYIKWLYAKNKKTRVKYAHKMVMACNRAIENELTNHLALKELTK